MSRISTKRTIRDLVVPRKRKYYEGRSGLSRRAYELHGRVKPIRVRIDGVNRIRYRIGSLAAATGLPYQVIRRWHDKGILPPRAREIASFHRYYTPWQLEMVVELATALREDGATLNTPEVRAIVERIRRDW